ncbi:NAD(P)H-dependent oxidoreductase [Curtobacterium sp. YC1]|uniref:FMN-dependent NADH-azoreductase n=1 Tax=Curtobacterium sp. YC1 TaxID=2795488 RepID=UPI0018E59A15|nr:NAD(P)H-dependent oxidoreductase [Curtobacterium sp. YC1]QQD76178.1 NAD(P)H-dependent oxidoreductase [Curtobacterium sp. YC1]
MTLFRLDASIRTEGSASRALGDIVETEWSAAHADAPVTRRHVGTDPVPATAWADAVAASVTPESERTPAQVAAVTLASELTDELTSADALLFAVPLYNFGVSQHFKSYVDLVLTDPRMAAGAAPATAGKPAVLVTVQGGNYSAGTPREGWDHATAWMRRILEDVWQLDLDVVTREFTLVGVNPALDQFTELADELRVRAEDQAARHGRALATVPRAA